MISNCSSNAKKLTWKSVLASLALTAGLSAQAQVLPWGLTLTNINDPIPTTVVTNGDGSISITAGGGDTYGAPDSFAFAYQKISGDFDIRVHVLNVTATDALGQDSPKASLMVRSSLAGTSYDFMINALPLAPSGRNGQIESIGRINLNTDTDDLPGRGFNYSDGGHGIYNTQQNKQGDTTDYLYCTYPDVWLRIQRQGEKLTSYYSTTNSTDYGYDLNPNSPLGWQILCVVHADPTNFPSTLYVGLATVAHNNDISNAVDTVTSTYASYGNTPTPASTPTVTDANGIGQIADPSIAPGAFPDKQVMAAIFHGEVPTNGMGYPGNTIQSNQAAPQQIIWNNGGFGSVSRDIISTIPYQTPGAFSYARYQAGAYDFQLNPRDPAAALQNLGAYTNPLRERYGNGGTNIPASQAWSPSPNYGFAYSTMNQNGRQWNDGSDFFYAATYMQIDSEAAGQGYDMVSGKYRGGQFYTRHTKIVTGNTDPASGRSPGNFQRACASVAVTWFPYSQGWKAGYFDSWASGSIKYDIVDGNPHWKYGDGWGMHSGTALHGSPDGTYQSSYNSPSNILSWIPTTDQSGNPTFLAQLTLPGVNSKTDGMLFTLGNQEGNGDRGPSAQNAALNDGSGWYVAVRDIEDAKLDPTSYATGNHADSAFSFLYVPYNANNLIGGHIAANGSKIKSAGNFTVQHITNGIYAITIPGKTGTNGVLMLQNTGYLAKQPTGYSNIVDNSFLSYEYGGTNVPSNAFIVNAVAVDPTGIDGTGTPGHEGTVKLQDAEFNFVYVDFLNPLTVPEPKLTLTRSGSNVTLSWDSATPAVLQSTTSLKAPVTWTDIGSANPSAPIAITGKAQYFRLRH